MTTRFLLQLRNTPHARRYADYTEVRATTREQAVTTAKTMLDHDYCEIQPREYGHCIAEATLFTVSNELELPLDEWRAEAVESKEQREAHDLEAKERAELQRLKQKYG